MIGIVAEGDSTGHVPYADLGYEDYEGPMLLGRMFPVAASFDAFIERLVE